MLAKLFTYSLFGIEARAVEVEVDISSGSLPRTILVGLAEAAVRESTHRIERALVNSGYVRPTDRIVISLSPADLPKDAASFDLPIALGLLVASGQLQGEKFKEFAVVGELALDGRLRPIRGVLSMALAAREVGRAGIVVPLEKPLRVRFAVLLHSQPLPSGDPLPGVEEVIRERDEAYRDYLGILHTGIDVR